MSDTVTFQGNRTEDGLVRINDFGSVEISLFPTSKYGYASCNSEELKTIIRDLFRLFLSKRREGIVHGRRVRMEYTGRSHLKTARLSAGFLTLVLQETKRRSTRMAILRIESPFDATTGGSMTNSSMDDQWGMSDQFRSEGSSGADDQWGGRTQRRPVQSNQSGEQW